MRYRVYRDHGVEGDYRLVPGGLHGVALRAPWGRPVPLPRAHAWAGLVAQELDRFEQDS